MARMDTVGDFSTQTLSVMVIQTNRLAVALLLSALWAIGVATPANAGAVLLSGQNSRQAAGFGTTGGFNPTDGTNGFGDYSSDISNTAINAPNMSVAISLTIDPVASGGHAQGNADITAPRRGGAVAAPLLPAVWTGLMMLGGLGVMMFRSRSGGGNWSI